MEIEFVIPNGRMRIDPDVFFREAARGRIRRMLRLMRRSGPDPELAREIREWLDGEIQALNEKAKSSAVRLMDCQTCLREAIDRYSRMQDPRYAVYTTDEGRLAEAKKSVSRFRASVTAANRIMREAAELAGKHQGVLEDVDKILGG